MAAFGLGALGRAVLGVVTRVPARRLARQVLSFDGIVGEAGLGAGGAWALERMCRSARVEGRDNVPRGGPLLLVSDHPGLADAVALFAATPREDLRVIAADRPFLDCPPQHLAPPSDRRGSPGGAFGCRASGGQAPEG